MAFDYFIINAQETEADYPYTSGKGDSGSCKQDERKGKVNVDSSHDVYPKDIASLKAAVA